MFFPHFDGSSAHNSLFKSHQRSLFLKEMTSKWGKKDKQLHHLFLGQLGSSDDMSAKNNIIIVIITIIAVLSPRCSVSRLLLLLLEEQVTLREGAEGMRSGAANRRARRHRGAEVGKVERVNQWRWFVRLH